MSVPWVIFKGCSLGSQFRLKVIIKFWTWSTWSSWTRRPEIIVFSQSLYSFFRHTYLQLKNWVRWILELQINDCVTKIRITHLLYFSNKHQRSVFERSLIYTTKVFCNKDLEGSIKFSSGSWSSWMCCKITLEQQAPFDCKTCTCF